MKTIAATAITPAARDWLAHASGARVLNAFDCACNLIAGDGTLLTLSTPDVGRTPFSLTVAPAGPAPFRRLTAGAPACVGEGALALDGLRVNFAAAPLWDPRPDWVAVRQALAASPGALAGLLARALEARPPGSLLDLYRPPGNSGPLLERVRRGAEALGRGLRSGTGETLREGARLLAGAGGGLTPAGDDFMAGAMLAAWAGLADPGVASRCPVVVEIAAPLTTALSAAFLRAAALGACAEQWHALFNSLAAGQVGDWKLEIESLLGVGHTSGADALAGFLWVYNVPEIGSGSLTAARPANYNHKEMHP